MNENTIMTDAVSNLGADLVEKYFEIEAGLTAPKKKSLPWAKIGAIAAGFAAVVLLALALPALLGQGHNVSDRFIGGEKLEVPPPDVSGDRLMMYGLVYYGEENLFKIDEGSGFYRFDPAAKTIEKTGLRAPVSPTYAAPYRDGYAYFGLQSREGYHAILGYTDLGAGGIWRQNLRTGENELYVSVDKDTVVNSIIIHGDTLYYDTITHTGNWYTEEDVPVYQLKAVDMKKGAITLLAQNEYSLSPLGVYDGKLYCSTRNGSAYDIAVVDLEDNSVSLLGLSGTISRASFDLNGNGNTLCWLRNGDKRSFNRAVFSPEGKEALAEVSDADSELYDFGDRFTYPGNMKDGKLIALRRADAVFGWYDILSGDFTPIDLNIPREEIYNEYGDVDFSYSFTEHGVLLHILLDPGKYIYLIEGTSAEAIPYDHR